MILTITIWAIAFFVLFSFGDILISGYNKICKNEESYGIMDTVVLGMCSILIPLQALSLFFPSNQYTLLLFVAAAITYWLFNKAKFNTNLSRLKDIYRSFSRTQKGLVYITILLILISTLLPDRFYDADFYHLQNIKWNEQFAAVPGLANLEDRFGFNSNYLLLSSILTFSFISGKAHITLQGLLFTLLLIWSLTNCFRSKYDIRHIIILILFLYLYYLSLQMLRSSSTDVIPLLCTFYFIARSALSPNAIANDALFSIVLPVALITYKTSTVFLCIFICLYVIIKLINKKKYKELVVIAIVSVSILVLWFARNVIISGYLVFPIYQIDLFSPDWKLPSAILKIEQEHIKAWANWVFAQSYSEITVRSLTNLFVFALALFLPIILFIKRKGVDKDLIFLALFSYIVMLICFMNAPDFRFFNGFILGCIFIISLIFLSGKNIHTPKRGLNIVGLMILSSFILIMVNTPLKAIGRSLLKPPRHAPIEDVDEYNLGSLTILLTNDHDLRSFYTLPCVPRGGLPFEPYIGNKVQSIETIEARGETLQKGFRTKKEYIDLLNQDVEIYLTDYYKKKYNIEYK